MFIDGFKFFGAILEPNLQGASVSSQVFKAGCGKMAAVFK
jgi:hypothetical protein